MAWDTDLTEVSNANYDLQHSANLPTISSRAAGWRILPNNDTIVFAFWPNADLTIRVLLFDEVQTNVVPFDTYSLSIDGDSGWTYLRFTGFPPDPNDSKIRQFAAKIYCQIEDKSRSAGSYRIYAPR